MELVKEDHVLENPKVDMAFAAHGWPQWKVEKLVSHEGMHLDA